MPATRREMARAIQGVLLDDHLLSHFQGGRARLAGPGQQVWQPLTDMYETSDGLVVRMELAGVRPEDTQVLVEDGRTLTVRGTRRRAEETGRYYQMEVHYGAFQRRLRLPKPVDAERVTACCKGGFLRIVLPLAEVEQEPIRLTVVITS